MNAEDFVREFSNTVKWSYTPSEEIYASLENLLLSVENSELIPKHRRTGCIFYHASRKFKFNADGVRSFLGFSASHKITFNYHEKNVINKAFDENNESIILDLIRSKEISSSKKLTDLLMSKFSPIDKEGILQRLHSELQSPTLTRKDSKPKDRSCEILASLFCAYLYTSFSEECIHKFNNPTERKHKYYSDYWKYLHSNHPDLFSRDNVLYGLHITEKDQANFDGYKKLSLNILEFVQSAYANLTNHGYLAILIDPINGKDESSQWKLFSDITLYAEKHITYKQDNHFTRSKDIKEKTLLYIPNIDTHKAEFPLLNRGFHYQDTFVIGTEDNQKILILFQKNEPDDRIIPCPACRSNNIQSNSYSSLGIKSWECDNLLCPERTKFNRGKRFSFLQILKHSAIKDQRNLIPKTSVNNWSRDVQLDMEDTDVLEMLIGHYSLYGDTVRLYNWSRKGVPSLGRKIISRPFEIPVSKRSIKGAMPPNKFFLSSFFYRFMVDRDIEQPASNAKSIKVNGTTAILGDSYDILSSIEENTFDGAVTSPPYYNAREYSQWDNIYTYLYDMYNINKMVYRVLRSGGIYLFNIFDYFDNENNIALSAMGEKRMILGAYVINIFKRIGFKCVSNIIWDKGNIEGKRGFNNGNFSPYYQSPFNCWEHILVFRKPGNSLAVQNDFPKYLREKPVVKMIQGKNIHGHTAPFPITIPEILINALPNSSMILDPFSGSMTTGVAASRLGAKSVCVEMDEKYFNLGVSKLKTDAHQYALI